jgi:hypothetical protein
MDYSSTLSRDDAARLAACHLPALTSLGFHTSDKRAPSLLLSASWAAGLQRLDLSLGNDAVSATLDGAQAAMAALTALTDLSLRMLHPTHEQMAALLSAPWASTLERFDLMLIGDDGVDRYDGSARALSRARLPSLRALALCNARVDGEHLDQMQRAWFSQLTSLELQDSGLSRCFDGWASLSRAPLPALRELRLRIGSRSSFDEVAAFSAAQFISHLDVFEAEVWVGGVRDFKALRDLWSGPTGPPQVVAARGGDAAWSVVH